MPRWRLIAFFLLIACSAAAFGLSIARNGSDIVVTFNAIQGDTYRLERKAEMTDAAWQSIAGVNDFTASITPGQITHPGAINLGRAFYEVFQVLLLSVSKTGTGSGTVTSSPSGIDCGTTCSRNYEYNTTVTLTATPGTGFAFRGWSGACSNFVGNCVLTMDAAKSVSAQFITPHVNCIGTPCSQTLSGQNLGQTYDNSTAVGTYSLALAFSAADAWPVTGNASTSFCTGGVNLVFKQTANSCTTWAYSGAVAGHVHYNSSGGNVCLCPGPADPTWN